MYNDKHTAKCRPALTNGICFGGTPSLRTEVSFVCGCLCLLKIFLRKCADYLAVWKIRVNTHTHTHTHTHTQYRHARQDTNYPLIINALARNLLPDLTGFFLRQHQNYHIPPPWLMAVEELCPTAICEVQSVPVCRRPALCPTPKIQNPIYE